MSFETVSLMLNWLQMGALLAILFRLGHTFKLIASTQHELRRAIHNLGEHRAASSSPYARARARARAESTIGTDDLTRLSPAVNR
jgi:hypothetical protein